MLFLPLLMSHDQNLFFRVHLLHFATDPKLFSVGGYFTYVSILSKSQED